MTEVERIVAELKSLNADILLLLAEGRPAFVLVLSAEGKIGRVEPEILAPDDTPNLVKTQAMVRGLAVMFADLRIQGYALLSHCWLVDGDCDRYKGVVRPEDVPMDDRLEFMVLTHRMRGERTCVEWCKVHRQKGAITHSPWAAPDSDGLLKAVGYLAVPDW